VLGGLGLSWQITKPLYKGLREITLNTSGRHASQYKAARAKSRRESRPGAPLLLQTCWKKLMSCMRTTSFFLFLLDLRSRIHQHKCPPPVSTVLRNRSPGPGLGDFRKLLARQNCAGREAKYSNHCQLQPFAYFAACAELACDCGWCDLYVSYESLEVHDCCPAPAWLQGCRARCCRWHRPAPFPPPETQPQGYRAFVLRSCARHSR
jgi:hypothetical protein